MKLKWQKPEETPSVEIGTETKYWIAIEVKNPKTETTTIKTLLAYYQNRPFDQEKYDIGEIGDEDALVNCDGDYVDSVGWVSCKEHVEFENYYTPFNLDNNAKLMGWAEYIPPEFTSF